MSNEPVLDPGIPIVDPHHHLWVAQPEMLAALAAHTDPTAGALSRIYRRHPRYLLDEFLQDVNSGHDVRATVFVEVHTMHRTTGPVAMRSVGEIEFANGVAAMSASGLFGRTLVCAAIMGGADLRLGDGVREVLEAHIRAGGDRFRGIRASGVGFDENLRILGEAFGTRRCMFESNYPVDAATAPYPVIWNAFKRIAANASPTEKADLFSKTATRVYQLKLPD